MSTTSAGGLGRALLYARTARRLKYSQWFYRALRTAQRVRTPVPKHPTVSPSSRGAALGAAIAAWQPGELDGARERAGAARAGRFRFLNEERTLTSPEWRERVGSHLWSFNLQYFDFARDVAAVAPDDPAAAAWFADLAVSWIDGTADGHGDGWTPYPISLRAVNWIYARLLFGDLVPDATARRIDASIAQQLALLERRLELHILANHYQKNLKALVVGGLYFEGDAAARWLRQGSARLWEQLLEQALPDGGHYERSPMYHAIALGDFLEVIDLLRAAGEPVPAAAIERVRAMVRAFGVLSRPDGALHLFNDAAHGIAPDRAWLSRLAEHVLGEPVPDPQGCVVLPETGYHAWIDADSGERLVVDCGPPGPDYQPGHAHCDMLSFELDLFGRPFIVDAGVSGYDGDPLRSYVRSTRAHNTVVIDGREQSEVWGTFRLARPARPLYGESSASDGAFAFRGGCRPCHGRGVHHRTIARDGAGWRINDRVERAAGVRIESWLHFHPECALEQSGEAVLVRTGGHTVRLEPFGVDSITIVRGTESPPQGWYCPEFGVAVPAFALRLDIHANDGRAFGCRITPQHA